MKIARDDQVDQGETIMDSFKTLWTVEEGGGGLCFSLPCCVPRFEWQQARHAERAQREVVWRKGKFLTAALLCHAGHPAYGGWAHAEQGTPEAGANHLHH